MKKPLSDKQRRRKHVDSQNKYVDEKTKTHQRICMWIPKKRVDEFKAAVARLNKKWAKEQ